MTDLKKLASQTPSVIFTGYQFGAVLEELFSNAAAFITASELEGLPITLLEALSYGTMCVISDIGPHRELMHSLPGLIFPVGDVAAIEKHMNHVEIMSDNDYAAFKQDAIAMISSQFSWETACDEHDRLYRKSLDR